jgi:hypothetical protein
VGGQDIAKTMSERENIPHVEENVDLVPDSRSHGGAPGFNNFHLNLALVTALSVLFLLSYFIFSPA